MQEIELKFQVPGEAVERLRAEFRRRGVRPRLIVTRYHDTADALLARHGYSLRTRRLGGRWTQTLKRGDEGSIARAEHEVDVRASAAAGPLPDPARHAGTPVGDALARLLAGAGQPPLQDVAASRIQRMACTETLGDGRVELALDTGTVSAGGRTLELRELEVELLDGGIDVLFAAAAPWLEWPGLFVSVLSKSRRGQLLGQGLDHGPAVKAAAPRRAAAASGAAWSREMLRAALAQVLANASEVGLGSRAEEHIHQLRVGLRRLRVALREGAALDGALDPALERPLAVAFGALGVLRDEQAVSRTVRPLLEGAGAPSQDWGPPPAAPDAGAVVRDTTFQRTLLRLLHVAMAPPPAAGPGRSAVINHLRQRLGRLHRALVRDGAGFAGLPLEAQHQVRKRLKRLRYLAEFAAPLWRRKAASRFVQELDRAQDALGEHNDVAVGAARFAGRASRDPAAWFAAGFLQGYGRHTACRAQSALAALADAPRFWRDAPRA